MYDRVIVPTDGSEIAERGVEEGLEVAEGLDIPALCIYVMHISAFEELGEEMHEDDIHRGMENVGEKALKKVRIKAHDMGVEIETKNLIGEPYKRIVDIADEDDIIYMSSHGASGFSELVFGSTTERVVKKAGCTVAVVKAR
ncbi:MAG: universal stress protein [Candidatus Thermoplasmatota archaeon]